MTVTVQYAIRRDELWSWYWTAWKRRLWIYHVAIVAMTILTFVQLGVGGSLAPAIVAGSAVGLMLVGVMILYPQIRYRPEERTLTFDETGLSYQRGEKAGRMQWSRIRSVTGNGDAIVVMDRGQNAFIIPGRAFRDAGQRGEALVKIAALHQGAT